MACVLFTMFITPSIGVSDSRNRGTNWDASWSSSALYMTMKIWSDPIHCLLAPPLAYSNFGIAGRSWCYTLHKLEYIKGIDIYLKFIVKINIIQEKQIVDTCMAVPVESVWSVIIMENSFQPKLYQHCQPHIYIYIHVMHSPRMMYLHWLTS